MLSFDGINDTAYRGRLARLKPDDRDPYFEKRLKQALGNATLTRLEITPSDVRDTSVPLSVVMRFDVENALIEGSGESLLKPPTLINSFGLFGALLGNGIGLDERKYPLKTDITCGVTETVRLDLRKSSLRPTVLPEYETIDTPELLLSRSATSSNGVITSRADLMLRTVEFTPEQYLELKQTLKIGEQNARKQLILSPGGFPLAADLATLEEIVEYTLYDSKHPVTPACPAIAQRATAEAPGGGGWKKEHTVRQKILTYAGKKAVSDLKIAYNSATQLAQLDSATITAADGTVREIDPEKEINLMDQRWVGSAPRYPAEKILVASLPGVEIGSIIETKTTTFHRDLPFFSAIEHFAGHNPLVKKTVRLRMPYKTKVDIVNLARGIIRRRTSHDEKRGHVVHEWSIENQEMIKSENHLAPSWRLTPTLLLSRGDIGDYAKTLKKALLKAAKQDDAAKAKARELTKGKSRSEKIETLRNFVDRNIRAAGPSLPALPLSAITPADQILADGYGNTTDRAVLLYAMCDAAKLKPRFVLVSNLPRDETLAEPIIDTLQRGFFGTVLVAIENKKETTYLGDSGQYAQLGTLAHNGQPAIDLKTGDLEIPQTSLIDSTETVFKIDLSENGHIDLTQQTAFNGTAFEAFHKRFAEFTPEERRREHQSLLSGLSQSAKPTGELRTSFEYPGEIEFSASIESYAVREDEHLYLTLPGGLGNLLGLQSTQRDNDFYIRKPITRSFVYEITLPEGWRPALIPESFRVELPNGAGTVEVLVGMVKGKLMLTQRAELKPALIGVENYEQLLDLNNRLTQPAAQTILLKKM